MSEQVRVVVVVDWRRQRVNTITSDNDKAVQSTRDLVDRYGRDPLAATMTAWVVDAPDATEAYERGRAEARVELLDLLEDLLDDPEPCWYDHHGYCQEHGWTRTDPPCAVARAKALLAEARPQT